MPLRETLDNIRNGPTPGNEESAKMWILVPILQDLGWQPFDIQWEYQVGRSKGRVDAALTGPKGVTAFIEAKAPGNRLDDHVEQVLGYAFQEGANICALTTGLEWWLYLPAETDYNFDERRFAELRLKDDPVEQLATDFVAFLGKETLLDGEAEKKAKQVLKARREAEHLDKEVPGIWREMLVTPDEELIELVSKRVYEKTNLRPTSQQVNFALTGRLSPPSTSPRRPVDPPNKEIKPPTSTPGPTAIRLWGETQSVKSNADILRCVIDGLLERGETEFENIPGIGGITRTPYQPKMKDYYQVGSTGIYFVTGKGRAVIEDTYRLLEHFDYTRSDLEIIYGKMPPPNGMKLWGKYYQVKSWISILDIVVDSLYERHGHNFEPGLELRNQRGPYISRESSDIERPRQVGAKDLYLDRNIGHLEVKERAKELLEAFGYKASDLEIIEKEKASGFEFLGKYHEVKHNYQVLVGVAEVLFEQHGNDFEGALDLKGILRKPESVSPKNYREVGSSGIFVRLPDAKFFSRSYQLVEYFGYKASALRIDTTTGSVNYSTLDISRSKRYVKPVRIRLFDEYHKVKLWKEIIMRLADVLYRRHRSDFDRVLGLGTEKNPYASRLSVVLESAYEVGNSGIYIETGLSSDNVKRRSKKLLEEFGYKPEELEILFD